MLIAKGFLLVFAAFIVFVLVVIVSGLVSGQGSTAVSIDNATVH
jgi:hypothetical protein